MLNWELVRLSEITPVPWKNGGGFTRELLTWPPSGEDWHMRLSVAEVANSGPFSSFIGVTRWFAVLQGDGVVLDVAGRKSSLTSCDPPLCFDGAASTYCYLTGGSTQDFNLMVRNRVSPANGADRAQSARLERANGVTEWAVNAIKLVAVYAHATGADIDFGEGSFALKPNTLAWCIADKHTQIRLESADALWIEVRL